MILTLILTLTLTPTLTLNLTQILLDWRTFFEFRLENDKIALRFKNLETTEKSPVYILWD